MTKRPTPAITMKIKPTSLRLVRLIAATTGEKQYEVLDRLIETEAKQLKLKLPKQ
jgi:hypothetical protein